MTFQIVDLIDGYPSIVNPSTIQLNIDPWLSVSRTPDCAVLIITPPVHVFVIPGLTPVFSGDRVRHDRQTPGAFYER
jgi:hypothetical protein